MVASLVRKISPKTVAGDKLRRLDQKDAPAEVVLYDVFGIVNDVRKSKPDAERAWIGFVGQFEAVTPEGEIFQSGQCFLVQPITDMLYSALKQSEASSVEGHAQVQMAVRISIVAPSKSADGSFKQSMTGYEFRVKPLIESQSTSPLALIKQQAADALKTLDQPKLAAPDVKPKK